MEVSKARLLFLHFGKQRLPHKVHSAPIDSPTPLAGGLEVFSHSHTEGFSESAKELFYNEVEAYCLPTLYSKQNGWLADYVRLRFFALKE